MAKKNQKTTEDVLIDIIDGNYELVNMPVQNISTGIGNFKLAELTTDQADRLIAIGCKWIRKK